MNLDNSWKECLKMWKGVIEILDYCKGYNIDIEVYDAKVLWLLSNGYNHKNIRYECFFCQYALDHHGHFDYLDEDEDGATCSKCPATLVDPDFCCENNEFDWSDRPKEFYNELVRLNKVRIKRNKKKGN